jgi:hypothetical protein
MSWNQNHLKACCNQFCLKKQAWSDWGKIVRDLNSKQFQVKESRLHLLMHKSCSNLNRLLNSVTKKVSHSVLMSSIWLVQKARLRKAPQLCSFTVVDQHLHKILKVLFHLQGHLFSKSKSFWICLRQ